ncbi:hypothetical protein H4219_004721 [Mycoemilia scoparia]|uniref:Uncharacterized protein n=1 Tax=Mycoemilia scoparia TaxID=417184 RepID=A0A9W8A086_9FUNG|nr:hypothetical protein H4219_004721 [Mycoemilia scoparia]
MAFSLGMVTLINKAKICDYLLSSGQFETLEELEKVDHEWKHEVMLRKWKTYHKPQEILLTRGYYGIGAHYDSDASTFNVSHMTIDKYKAFLREGFRYVSELHFPEFSFIGELLENITCPLLKTVVIDCNPRLLRALPNFIRNNPTITTLKIAESREELDELDYRIAECVSKSDSSDSEASDYYEYRVEVDLVVQVISDISANLVEIEIEPIIHLPSLSFFLEKLPSLKSLNIRYCDIDDLSDVFVPVRSGHWNNPLWNGPSQKVFKSLTKLSFELWFTSVPPIYSSDIYPGKNKTNSQAHYSHQPSTSIQNPETTEAVEIKKINRMFLNPRQFPNLLSIEHYLHIGEPNTPLQCHNLVYINITQFIHMPYKSLTKLSIQMLFPLFSSSIVHNCPNIKDLSIKIDPELYELRSIHIAFKILATKLKYVEHFILDITHHQNPDKGIFFDGIFFETPPLDIEIMKQEWEGTLPAIDRPPPWIIFGWSKLVSLKLYSGYGFNPIIFYALSQFKQLRSLGIHIYSLHQVELLSVSCIRPLQDKMYNKTSNKQYLDIGGPIRIHGDNKAPTSKGKMKEGEFIGLIKKSSAIAHFAKSYSKETCSTISNNAMATPGISISAPISQSESEISKKDIEHQSEIYKKRKVGDKGAEPASENMPFVSITKNKSAAIATKMANPSNNKNGIDTTMLIQNNWFPELYGMDVRLVVQPKFSDIDQFLTFLGLFPELRVLTYKDQSQYEMPQKFWDVLKHRFKNIRIFVDG